MSLINTDNHLPGALICKFRGSGQTCICANRIYVHSSVYAEFGSRLASRVAEFKVGDGMETLEDEDQATVSAACGAEGASGWLLGGSRGSTRIVQGACSGMAICG